MTKLLVPLAYSYNQRGSAPDTTITSSIDQRILNAYQDVVENSFSGNKTLYCKKRPGTDRVFSWGVANTTTPYLLGWDPSVAWTNPLLLYKDGNDLNSINTSGTTATLATSANDIFSYIDSGYLGGNLYTIVTTSAPAHYITSNGTSWTQLTDADIGSTTGKMEFMDGYLFVLRSDNYIAHSDLGSGTAWSASSRILKSIQSDYPVGLARLKNQILAFGRDTVEPFYNAGNVTGSVLARIPHLATKIGMSIVGNSYFPSGHYYCTIEDKLYFLGAQAGGTAVSLYMYDGSRFEEIKNPIISREFSQNKCYSINSLPVLGKMAVSLLLTSPSSTSGHRWFMFFPEDNKWFEWTSNVFFPVNLGSSLLGAQTSGVSVTNKTFAFTTNTFQDDVSNNPTNYQWLASFGLPSEDGDWHTMSECGVVGDTNRTATSLTIEKSTDDFQNWVSVGTIDMTKNKKVKYGMGTYRDMAIRLSYTGANDIRLESFYANIS